MKNPSREVAGLQGDPGQGGPDPKGGLSLHGEAEQYGQ